MTVGQSSQTANVIEEHVQGMDPKALQRPYRVINNGFVHRGTKIVQLFTM